eukprot:4481583-Amphidinium_carterae.1
MVGAFDAVHRELVFGVTVPLAEMTVGDTDATTDTLPSGCSVRLAVQLAALFRQHVQPLLDVPGIPTTVKRVLTETNT